jgi:hypothetical protein
MSSSLKAVGLFIAWIGGVACGWQVFQQSNLLDAVLRGAGAWVALMALWLAAVAFCERYILSHKARPRSGEDREAGMVEAGREARQ